MTAEIIFSKFKDVFGYLKSGAKSYKTINSDPRSIRVTMKDGTIYIFTYPPNGHYTLVTERLGKILQEEREENDI